MQKLLSELPVHKLQLVHIQVLLQIAAAAFPMVARLGSGGFGLGYSAKLDNDDGTYGAVKLGGRKVGVFHAVLCHRRGTAQT